MSTILLVMRVLRIEHLTEYRFGQPVTLLPHRLLIRPRESHGVRITSSALDIQPAHDVRWLRDVLDNSIALVTFRESADYLRVGSTTLNVRLSTRDRATWTRASTEARAARTGRSERDAQRCGGRSA
jgi:hypothetical protein